MSRAKHSEARKRRLTNSRSRLRALCRTSAGHGGQVHRRKSRRWGRCRWWCVVHDQDVGSAGFVKLPNERTLYTSPQRVSLQVSTPNTFPAAQPLSIESDAGVVYTTNQRVWRRLPTLQTCSNSTTDSLPTSSSYD